MKKRAWISMLIAAVSFVLAAAGCKAGGRPSAGKADGADSKADVRTGRLLFMAQEYAGLRIP